MARGETVWPGRGVTAPTAANFAGRQAGVDVAELVRACKGSQVTTYRLGNATLAVRCATDRHAAWFAPGIRHLLGPAGPGPRLEIAVDDDCGVFDGLESQQKMEGWPRYRIGDGHGVVGAVWPRAGMGGLVDRECGKGIVWVRNPETALPADAANVFRGLVAWWLRAPSYALAHSAAVAGAAGAALVVGPSGSGKSSSAVAAAAHGLAFLGDDTVLLDIDRTEVLSLCREANLCTADLAIRHPRLVSGARGGDRDGKCFVAVEAGGLRVSTRAPIRAFVRPIRALGREPDLVPVERSRLLMTLAPSSLLSIPGADRGAFAALSALVRRLPAYELHLTGDPASDTVPLVELLGGPPE